MKKRIASLALVATLLAGALPSHASSYPKDIANSRYKDAIEYSYDNNIVKGYSDGSFKPEDTISRAEFVVMVARWRKLSLGSRADFSDAKNSWASKEIAAVAKRGWMVGTGDGKFSPDEKISYIEALTVMVRAVGKKGEAEEFGGYPLGYSYTADRYGFTERISGRLETPIYRGAVSQLVYNSKDRFDAVEDGTEDSSTGLVDKLGTVKSYEFLESRHIRVQKDMDLASAIELLPREVYVVLESGRGVLLKVNWDSKSSYNKDSAGTYSIKGNVELPSGITDPKKKIPTLYGSIEVVEGEPDTSGEKIVNSYAQLGTSDFQTEFGDSEAEALKKLVSKTRIYLIGGGSVEADISWTIPGYNGLQPKKYDAIGRIVLPTGVVDRLEVIEDLKATLTVKEEPDTLGINSVDMISATEYKITLNKMLQKLLPGMVTIEKSGVVVDIVDKPDYGSSKKELIVKLKEPLDQAKTYTFKVSDGEGNDASGTPVFKPNSNTIDKVIVGDNIIPADEPTKLNFKALNADGVDITESVRDEVDVVSTIGATVNGAFKFTLGDSKAQFFYLEYKDKDYDEISNKVMKKTPTYSIAGENRRVVSIEDWTFVGDSPDWSNTVKVLYKGGGDKKLYIRPRDQFGDVGKAELLNAEKVTAAASPANIASITPGDIVSKGLESGAKSDYSKNSIATLTPLVIGTGKLNIEIERVEGNFNTSLDFRVLEESKSNSISVEKNSIVLSSSSSLEYAEDRSETVKVKVKDQHGNYIGATQNIVDFVEPSGEGSPIVVSRVGEIFDEFIITAKKGAPNATGKVKFTYVLEGKTMTTEITVAVKSPGTVSYMDYRGFKEELIKDTDDINPDTSEKMEIKIYQYDKDGVSVNRVKDKITAEIINKGVKLTGGAKPTMDEGVVTVDSTNLTANTVNTLLVKVGGITVLEEKFVVR